MSFEMPTPQAGPQTDFILMDDSMPLVFYGGAAGGGKALELDTKVLTPKGWFKVRDLHVGDEVIDSLGKKQRIIAEYPQPIKPLYEVKFRDGATITCCGEHLWSVNLAGKDCVVDTNYIRKWMYETNNTPVIPLYSPTKGTETYIESVGSLYIRQTKLDMLLSCSSTDGEYFYYPAKDNTTALELQYVVRSLGGIAEVSDNNWVLIFKTKAQIEQSVGGNEIVSIEYKHDGFSKCFTVTGERSEFVIENFIVTHNTFSLLLDCLKYIDCPNFYGVYFRSTTKQVERALWPLAKSLYFPFLIHQSGLNKGKYKGKAQIRERDKVIFFPSGAKVEFTYLDDLTVEENWQGAEITAAYFDEFTHYGEFAFNYVRTRMRSPSKYKSFIRCSLNPNPTHFVLKYLDRFIGEDGFAIKDYSGKYAYFVFDKGELVTSWSKEELEEKYPKLIPRLYTFIPSSLKDNPKMLESNPEYADDLQANDPANAALLLEGNWRYSPAANGFFERSTVQVVDREPFECTYIRAWDKASSKPVKEGGDSKQLDPDYTASILMAKDKNGFIYVMGNYVREKDEVQRARFREKPGPRDSYIEQQAYLDGSDVLIYLPKDPGAAGEVEFQEAAKKLQNLGFTVYKDCQPSNKSKKLRFEPFAAACYAGNVFWVKSTFDPAVWDYMLLELENFDGDKNNGYHDDLVDAFSTAYANLQQTIVYKAPPPVDYSAPTYYSQHMSGVSVPTVRKPFN